MCFFPLFFALYGTELPVFATQGWSHLPFRPPFSPPKFVVGLANFSSQGTFGVGRIRFICYALGSALESLSVFSVPCFPVYSILVCPSSRPVVFIARMFRFRLVGSFWWFLFLSNGPEFFVIFEKSFAVASCVFRTSPGFWPHFVSSSSTWRPLPCNG